MGVRTSKISQGDAPRPQHSWSPGPPSASSGLEPPRMVEFDFLSSNTGGRGPDPASSIEPPRVSTYNFANSPAHWPGIGSVPASPTTNLEVIAEEHEQVQRDAVEPAYGVPIPPPTAPVLPAGQIAPPDDTVLPLSLLLDSTGLSWPNHVRLEAAERDSSTGRTWTVPETGSFPPMVYNRRVEATRYARLQSASNTSAPLVAIDGEAVELDAASPVSRRRDASFDSARNADFDALSLRSQVDASIHAQSPVDPDGRGGPLPASVALAEPPGPSLVVTEPDGEPAGRILPLAVNQPIVANDPTPPPRSTSVLVPPISRVPMATPGLLPEELTRIDSPTLLPPSSARAGHPGSISPMLAPAAYYDTSKPTCSLNLVCYRSGSRGCDLQQVHCIMPSLYPDEEAFQKAIASQPHLVYKDKQFFDEMNRLYTRKMCGTFRRSFSLKTLRAFRILAYTPTTRPTVVPFDDFVLQEMLYAYRNPDRISSSRDWIKWVFRLRRKDKRHALEFVEGWNTTRIAVAGTAPWLSSVLVGVIWSALGGDAQTAFTVASFILTSSSIILALLAVISSIESSGGLGGTRG